VETALGVLDQEGLEALSMRRVAEELGTGAASLYWHVGSKDGLLDLLFDHVIGELEVPDPEPARWHGQLKEVARTMRSAIHRHRDIVRVSMGRIPTGPNALRYTDRLLAILRSGGLSNTLALAGAHLLPVIVNGFTVEESVDLRPPGGGEAPPEQVLQMVSDYFASLPPEQFPNLVEVADEFPAADMDARFELLLDLFVDGLAARAAS
jgi:AcrR family transcriptional regulator